MMKYSKKRAKQNRQYSKKRIEFIENRRDEYGKIYCIFCGKEINGEPDIHHGIGRDNDLLLIEEYWFTAHNHCHVFEYHSKSCINIIWWASYMERIQHLPEVLQKEFRRMLKAGMIIINKNNKNHESREKIN